MRIYEGDIFCPNCGKTAQCTIDTLKDKLTIICTYCNYTKEDIGNWNVSELINKSKGN